MRVPASVYVLAGQYTSQRNKYKLLNGPRITSIGRVTRYTVSDAHIALLGSFIECIETVENIAIGVQPPTYYSRQGTWTSGSNHRTAHTKRPEQNRAGRPRSEPKLATVCESQLGSTALHRRKSWIMHMTQLQKSFLTREAEYQPAHTAV